MHETRLFLNLFAFLAWFVVDKLKHLLTLCEYWYKNNQKAVVFYRTLWIKDLSRKVLQLELPECPVYEYCVSLEKSEMTI